MNSIYETEIAGSKLALHVEVTGQYAVTIGDETTYGLTHKQAINMLAAGFQELIQEL